jgi:hypothetical protein
MHFKTWQGKKKKQIFVVCENGNTDWDMSFKISMLRLRFQLNLNEINQAGL